MDSNQLQHTMHTVTSLKKEYKTIAAAKTAFRGITWSIAHN